MAEDINDGNRIEQKPKRLIWEEIDEIPDKDLEKASGGTGAGTGGGTGEASL